MKILFLILALFIFAGCAARETLDDLYLRQSTCEATGEDCAEIAEKIERRERRFDGTFKCGPSDVEYKDKRGVRCVDRHTISEKLNRRY